MEDLRPHIEDILNTSIVSSQPLSGGDIAAVSKLETKTNAYVIKYGQLEDAKLFKAEAKGLSLIASTKTIATPNVVATGVHNEISYLLMDYIDSKVPDANDYFKLGTQLAKLHNFQTETFGLSTDNFIGRLPQNNNSSKDWIDFYSVNRLGFQFALAETKGLLSSSETPSNQIIKSVLKSVCHNIQPVLVHGDLWSGNYLIAKDGTPLLIDPAVYFGHSEVDIAMSKLFGGFDSNFYEAYHNVHPITNEYKARIDLYQLYYLLVHLNLFGSSYYGSVNRILKQYF